MNFNDIKNVKLSARIPPEGMTNEDWQQYFKVMRYLIKPSKDKRMTYRSGRYLVNGYCNNSYFTYDGETNYYRYVCFINNILKNIRKGEVDYCFFIYQVADLLRYDYDDLVAVWLPESKCFSLFHLNKERGGDLDE